MLHFELVNLLSGAAMGVSCQDLLNSQKSFVAYRAALAMDHADAPRYKARLFGDAKIGALIDELQDWPGPQISSHKSANQFFHKLVFLADIGIDLSCPGITDVVEQVLADADDLGIPSLPLAVSTAYGGTGERRNAWALCDAPSTLYALVTLGVVDERVENAIAYLVDLVDENGYGCNVSKSLGIWRGPGKKTDPCPYATLVMLKLMLLFGDRFRYQIDVCVHCLLDLWKHSKTKHPYIFYMGDDFRKLKLPFIWYDILHVADVLSKTADAKQHEGLWEMLGIIQSKETPTGYVPESVYQPWKAWDFGQKKTASEWMTLCVRDIERRLDVT